MKIIELFDENLGNTSFEVPFDDIVKNDFYFGISRYTKNKWALVNPSVLEKNKATQQSPKHFSQSIFNFSEIFLLSICLILTSITFLPLFKSMTF